MIRYISNPTPTCPRWITVCRIDEYPRFDRNIILLKYLPLIQRRNMKQILSKSRSQRLYPLLNENSGIFLNCETFLYSGISPGERWLCTPPLFVRKLLNMIDISNYIVDNPGRKCTIIYAYLLFIYRFIRSEITVFWNAFKIVYQVHVYICVCKSVQTDM